MMHVDMNADMDAPVLLDTDTCVYILGRAVFRLARLLALEFVKMC